jgi:hypothetical protein
LEEFGMMGWGPPILRIFDGKSTIRHATSTRSADSLSRLSNYYTSELGSIVQQYYKDDYALEVYNLTMKKIHFPITSTPQRESGVRNFIVSRASGPHIEGTSYLLFERKSPVVP